MKIFSHIRIVLPKSKSSHHHHLYETTTSQECSSSSCTTNNSIIFPDGVSAEEYGLPPIKILDDVDGLQRFEVIRYLDGFNIEYNENLSEESLRKLLKDTIGL